MADTEATHDLLVRCRAQDRTAFAELFQHYHARVFRSAFLITRRADAADDVTQLVFVELFSAFRRYDLSRPFLPWLYRIVHNVSMDYLKRDRRGADMPLPAEDGARDALIGPDPAPGPAEQAEQHETQRAMWGALGRLPVAQRAVLVLRYYEGLNESEMATTLGCRRGTVKSRLHRALRALSAEVGQHSRSAGGLALDSIGGSAAINVHPQEGGK
jgi:RNA polymerase sigma-70 factor (ECF subfamily)